MIEPLPPVAFSSRHCLTSARRRRCHISYRRRALALDSLLESTLQTPLHGWIQTPAADGRIVARLLSD